MSFGPAHAVHEDALGDTVRTLDRAASPTARDKQFLFDAAFRHLEDWSAESSRRNSENADCKRTLIDWLLSAVPALAESRAALKCMFNRKLRAWTDAGGMVDALADKRPLASGRRRPDFTPDLVKIRNEAILHDGNESLAYRKFRQAGQLSAEFVKHYKFDARQNKSYLPAPVRAAITNEVEMYGPIHRGPWQARMRGPYIPRDWSDVQPADWFSGDDVTWNNYFYFRDEIGRLHIERGECLLLHDLRTGYILDFVLIAGKYNSRHIRKLILAVQDCHGLPWKGFYFERGVWKARIITDIAAKDSFGWRETESGLASYNLQVRHATTPRAKPIEGLFRILQDRQRNEPGYVGGNERTHEMERMQDFLSRVRRGHADPAEKLLSVDQWKNRLDTIFAEFNADPQNGKMLRGQSPAEAWHKGLNQRPLRKLPDNARYHLSTHCHKVRVRQEGIVLTLGKNRMLFCNNQTAALIGQDVMAYYNLDASELLTVSDLNRQNYFTVKAVSLPALSATKEQFAAVHSQIAGHTRHAREIYGGIKHQRSFTVADDKTASPETAALGEFHNAETARFKVEQAAEARTLRKIQLKAAGRPISANIRNPGRVLAGIELENTWSAEQSAAEFEAAEIPAPARAASPPSADDYRSLRAQIARILPGFDFHELTRQTIGCDPLPSAMTPQQLADMVSALDAVRRGAGRFMAGWMEGFDSARFIFSAGRKWVKRESPGGGR